MRKDQADRLSVGRSDASRYSSRVVIVSTYPPTVCGLASFSFSLRRAMSERSSRQGRPDVLELVDDREPIQNARSEVIASMNPANPWSLRRAAERISGHDALILQHEYGIWGPDMGSAVLDFLDLVDHRLITTLHTLLREPTRLQQGIIEALADRSDFVVVPTQGARRLLAARYPVKPESIAVIPHGTGEMLRSVALARTDSLLTDHAPRLLTWGLIGPGKGLEWALQAVALLKNTYPDIHYTVAGRTHPKVRAHEGESYRRRLQQAVFDLGISNQVSFIDDYLDDDRLHRLLMEATMVLLPYESTEQIMSGVLSEAVSANLPVVSSAFPHAIELAAHGAVATVPQHNPVAIADTVGTLLASPSLLEQMRAKQRTLAKESEWETVALRYEELVVRAVDGHAELSDVSTAS